MSYEENYRSFMIMFGSLLLIAYSLWFRDFTLLVGFILGVCLGTWSKLK